MALGNSTSHYGAVTKTLHWVMAIGILLMIPLGIIAHDAPYDTSEALARKAYLFSVHKTVGVTLFFAALIRIGWAFSQPKPALLNSEKPAESFLAGLVHWMLYASLVFVPLSGWIGHAATTGFAPIWWPFGQSLPFVPKDDAVAYVFSRLHFVLLLALVASLVLHIAGALKHHFVDRDATLRRMLPGRVSLGDLPAERVSRTPLAGAVVIYAVVLSIGVFVGQASEPDAGTQPTLAAQPPSQWAVQEGTIGISVVQLGSTQQGNFTEWTAAIEFDPVAQDGVHGSVDVAIAMASLDLGSSSAQAVGPEFLDSAQFPEARFVGPIVADGDGYVVQGELTIREVTVPVVLPFSLEINDEQAAMQGAVSLQRLDFGVGEGYKDDSQVGFTIDVSIELTATLSES